MFGKKKLQFANEEAKVEQFLFSKGSLQFEQFKKMINRDLQMYNLATKGQNPTLYNMKRLKWINIGLLTAILQGPLMTQDLAELYQILVKIQDEMIQFGGDDLNAIKAVFFELKNIAYVQMFKGMQRQGEQIDKQTQQRFKVKLNQIISRATLLSSMDIQIENASDFGRTVYNYALHLLIQKANAYSFERIFYKEKQQINRKLQKVQAQVENSKLQNQLTLKLSNQIKQQQLKLLSITQQTNKKVSLLINEQTSKATALILKKQQKLVQGLKQQIQLNISRKDVDVKVNSLNKQLTLLKKSIEETNKLNQMANKIIQNQQQQSRIRASIVASNIKLKADNASTYRQVGIIRREVNNLNSQLMQFKDSIPLLTKSLLSKQQMNQILSPMNESIDKSLKDQSNLDNTMNIIQNTIKVIEQTITNKLTKQNKNLKGYTKGKSKQVIKVMNQILDQKATQLKEDFKHSIQNVQNAVRKNRLMIRQINNKAKFDKDYKNPQKRYKILDQYLSNAIS